MKVNPFQYRVARERFYYALVVLVSIAAWGWIFYSVYKESTAAFQAPVAETPALTTEGKCFVKNSYPGFDNVGRVDHSQLLEGEECLPEDMLAGIECFKIGPDGEVRKVHLGSLWVGEFCLPTSELTMEEIAEARQAEKNEEASGASKLAARALEEFTPTKLSGALRSISTPIFLLILFFFSLFTHLLAMAFIRMNGVRVGPNQFPPLYEAVQRLSEGLGMRKAPDMFVITGHGVLNAFATRLVFRRLLVVYSDLAEALLDSGDTKQLEAVLAHELGHHSLGHTRVREWLLFPGKMVPLLGTALSRAREYSSDQVMKALIPDRETCERALVKLAAGGPLGGRVNIDSFVEQIKREGGFFAWLAEVLSTHPHLPKRIAAIRS